MLSGRLCLGGGCFLGEYSWLCPLCLPVCPALPPTFALICSLLRPQTLFSPLSTPGSPSRARCTSPESPRSRPGRPHPPAAAVRAPPVPVPTTLFTPPAPGFGAVSPLLPLFVPVAGPGGNYTPRVTGGPPPGPRGSVPRPHPDLPPQPNDSSGAEPRNRRLWPQNLAAARDKRGARREIQPPARPLSPPGPSGCHQPSPPPLPRSPCSGN